MTTTRAGLPYVDMDADADASVAIDDLADAVDAKLTIWLTPDTLADRPAASIAGRIYRSTDAGLYLDTGAAWVEVLIGSTGAYYLAGTYAARPAAAAGNAGMLYYVSSGNGIGARFQSDGAAWDTVLTVIPTDTLANRPAAHAGGAGRIFKASDAGWALDNGGTWVGLLTGDAVALLVDGAVGAPGLSFINDPDTGLYRSATNELSLATAGVQRVAVTAGGQLIVADGTVALPGVAFITDPDTGLYRVGANEFGLAVGGVAQALIDANGVRGATLRAVFDRVNQAGNLGATPTFDFSAYGIISGVVNVNVTGMTLTWPTMATSQGHTVELALYVGGTYTIAWDASIKWPGDVAPTLTSGKYYQVLLQRLYQNSAWRVWASFSERSA